MSMITRSYVVMLLFVATALPTLAQNLSSLATPLATPVGEHSSIAALGKGKVTVVVFWLTTCSPSKNELKAIQTLSDRWKDTISFVAVSIDNTKTITRVASYVAAQSFTFPVLLDPNKDVYSTVNGTEHPYTLVFSRDGTLQKQYIGFFEGDELKIDQLLTELTASTPSKP